MNYPNLSEPLISDNVQSNEYNDNQNVIDYHIFNNRQSKKQQSQEIVLQDHQLFIYEELLKMQIEEAVCLFLIFSTKSNSIEDIIDILTSDNEGMMNHLFYPSNEIDSCRICLLEQNFHYLSQAVDLKRAEQISQAVNRFLNPVSPDRQKAHQSLSIQDIKLDCQICLNNTSEKNFIILNNTRHQCCLDCFQDYLDTEISNGNVQDLRCPHCNITLQKNQFEKYLFKLQSKFERFEKLAEEKKNQLIWFCPDPYCTTKNFLPQELLDQDEKLNLELMNEQRKQKQLKYEEVKCSNCSIHVCVRCQLKSHQKITCEQASLLQLQAWGQGRDFSKCPQCKINVEKNEGCNHMTCASCKYQFCWICQREYSYNHYNSTNLLGCPGMQYRRKGLSTCTRICLYIQKFFLCILLFIFLPIHIAFSGPVYTFRYLSSDTNVLYNIQHSNCLCCMLGYLFIFLLSFIATPVTMFLAIYNTFKYFSGN